MSFTWQEVWVCSHINVLVSNHLKLSWVPVHATQAVQCAIWELAIQMGPQHPVREQCLEPLGQQCAARAPQTSDHCSRAPQKQQVSVTQRYQHQGLQTLVITAQRHSCHSL